MPKYYFTIFRLNVTEIRNILKNSFNTNLGPSFIKVKKKNGNFTAIYVNSKDINELEKLAFNLKAASTHDPIIIPNPIGSNFL